MGFPQSKYWFVCYNFFFVFQLKLCEEKCVVCRPLQHEIFCTGQQFSISNSMSHASVPLIYNGSLKKLFMSSLKYSCGPLRSKSVSHKQERQGSIWLNTLQCQISSEVAKTPFSRMSAVGSSIKSKEETLCLYLSNSFSLTFLQASKNLCSDRT